jgi:nicotinamidase-related amidase
MAAQPLTLDPQHSALLVMDYQQEILSGYAQDHPDLLEKAAAVLAAARAARVPIIYIVVRFRPGYPEVSPHDPAIAGLRASNRLQEGTPGAEIHPQVAPQPGEVVVVKRRVGAFSTTDLATILRAQGITTLLLMGIATSGVVLSTVCWAGDADYELVVVEDCCADRDPEVHRVLIEKVFSRRGSVVRAAELIAALATGSKPAE